MAKQKCKMLELSVDQSRQQHEESMRNMNMTMSQKDAQQLSLLQQRIKQCEAKEEHYLVQIDGLEGEKAKWWQLQLDQEQNELQLSQLQRQVEQKIRENQALTIELGQLKQFSARLSNVNANNRNSTLLGSRNTANTNSDNNNV